ncbi:MAG: ABC transporter ATP-binding protein, partial [Clostridiales bacterium]|nr:ABC transporter ATP-binding protein [Clostridiales bacterium]
TKTYPGGKVGVSDLSLEVQPGEIYGFIGHNGAGKTTTIKAVVGLHNFEAGKITIDGISISDDPIKAKSILAYIPDNPELYDNLTGMQYLNFVADVFRVPKHDRKARIETYAENLELINALNNQIASYSHGMKQKLAIIAAFLHHPKMIVMDEPFVGLDPKAAFIVKKIMREFCDQGNAIFFSTHVLEVAEKLCDKIAIIKDGKLIASGTMEEVKGDASLEEVFLGITEEAK